MDELFERLIEEDQRGETESRGYGEWVAGDDMPCICGEYLVRVRACLDGETVEFEDTNEPIFEVEDYEDGGFHDDWAGWVSLPEYHIEAYWDEYEWEKEGYTDITVLAWKQIED